MQTTRTLTQIDADLTALRATARRYDTGANEGSEGFNPHYAALHALEAERERVAEATADERIAAMLAAQDAAWTLELTVQRRNEWNAWVRSQGKSVHTTKVAEQITAQGWSVDELKRAIARHGL